MMTANQTPRPYRLTLTTADGTPHDIRVRAFDLNEAVFQAGIELQQRTGEVPASLLFGGPDLDAIKAETAQRGADTLAAVLLGGVSRKKTTPAD